MTVPSGRVLLRGISAGLLCVLVALLVAGCKGQSGASAQAELLGSAPDAASAKESSRHSTRTPGPVLPGVAPTSTLQPPSYDGFEPLPVFTYHHVDPKPKNEIAITPGQFEQHLRILRDMGYQTITARELVDHQTRGTALPEKPVMITFDDGWRTQYTRAWPLLKKYGFKATFFVNPQPISQGYRAYMSQGMVATLAQAGNDIESHTWKHTRLTRRREQAATTFQKSNLSALTNANDWIRKVAGAPPVAISYPYGIYDLETVGFVQAVGYKAGFTVDESVADARKWDRFQMKRFTINSWESETSFKRRLLSGPLPVSAITPAPGSRVVGVDAEVSVDISDVPSSTVDIMLRSGPSMKKMQLVQRNGRRYAVGQLRGCKVGFRVVSMSARDAEGRKYYASWSLVMGDQAR